jgi:hypothetical protein
LLAEAGHAFGVAFEAELLDLGDAGGAVGAEEESDEAGDHIVEFTAFFWVRIFTAVGAGGEAAVDAAGTDLAPSGFGIRVAAGAAAFEVGAAGSAVEAAIGD